MGYGYDRWPRYVPVAVRRRNAMREMEKLAKKGVPAQPVAIEGRKIAKTFWGKAWCDNLEGYSDFENRLPRGRTYVRNGSVCHLEITEGVVRANVIGSELYRVTIRIKPLSASVWDDIKKRCTGKIASLLDLLGGKLADGVMNVVTDRKNGLFPKPGEIAMDCSCPDWATMCKHVAAVLYGVGARLDERPELLFLLRGVNHLDLISATVEDAVASVVKGGSRRRIATGDLSEVFGVDVDEGSVTSAGPTRAGMASSPAEKRAPGAVPAKKTGSVGKKPGVSSGRSRTLTAPISKAPSKPAAKVPVKAPVKVPVKAPVKAPARAQARTPVRAAAMPFPEKITGTQIQILRVRLGLTAKDFAELLGVSGGAVSVWERNDKAINLQDRCRKALEKVWNANMKPKR
ncbi:MAG: hypothetical protein Q8O15_06300 [Rectinemataceae bacterium]|nr:hypothetical protein [Rectinemataceae bacterium]